MSSGKRAAQISLLAAAIGLVTAMCGLVSQVVEFPSPDPDPPKPSDQPSLVSDRPEPSDRPDRETAVASADTDDPFGCDLLALDPRLQLSDGRGPSGTELTVTGTDFCPEDRVEVSFHTETLMFAETDADGAFSVEVRIPGTLDFVAPQQIDIRAIGEDGGIASTPFQLTTQ